MNTGNLIRNAGSSEARNGNVKLDRKELREENYDAANYTEPTNGIERVYAIKSFLPS